MLATTHRWKTQGGYTLIEMIIVAGLVMVGSAIAIPVTKRMVTNAKGDSSQILAVTFLETARNRAVAERRNVEVTFLSDNEMQAERLEVPGPTRTIIDTVTLEGDAEFMRDAETPDTPDKSGGLAGAIKFTGPMPVMFTSDGSLIDSAGDVTSGTIFIADPDDPDSIRAVTIAGVTGLIRSWKWRGGQWMQ